MKVILVGGRCLNCACEKLNCDRGSPKCSNCTSAGIECKRPETRIQQACDRCRSKKIRCDGVRPSCTQCVNVGFECTHNDKISRRAFPRGYTESLEGMVRNLEFEIRELKDLLDEKDEKINSLNGAASEHTEQPAKREAPTLKKPSDIKIAQASELAAEHLHVHAFEAERNKSDARGYSASNQKQKITKPFEWIEEKVRASRSTQSAPAINLLVIKTPDDPMEEAIRSRALYNDVELVAKPVLDRLDISTDVLGTFGSVVFDKSSPHTLCSGSSDARSAHTFTYHIALGFFSLAFRYFPESKTCVGILLVQNYMDIATEFLRDVDTHRVLIGQPFLLPLLAHQAIAKLIASWLTQHKEVIIDAQAQTGFHHMVSLERSSEFVDYTQLSTKISGTAVNIATNELCWQALTNHAELLLDGLKAENNRLTLLPKSEPDYAMATFMENHASRLARNTQAMLREAESWQKKAMILVQGIFNLIAQQDQNTSIGIARDSRTLAEESKRDSTSMKAIAVVTMTYLPGTFVAVCILA